MPASPSRVFIASVFGDFAEVRAKLYTHLRAEGHTPWLAEAAADRAEWARRSDEEIRRVCLREVRESDLLLVFLGGSHGRSARRHPAGISCTDAELFEAIRHRKPIFCYVLESADLPMEVATLRTILVELAPSRVRHCRDEEALLEAARRDVPRALGEGSVVARSPFLSEPAYFSALTNSRLGGARGDEFQISATDLEGVAGASPDVEGAIQSAETLESYRDRFDAAFRAVSGLSTTPYWDPRHDSQLPRWDRALSALDKSAAWCGLHGPILLGRLAAAKSLVGVRMMVASNGASALTSPATVLGATPRGPVAPWAHLFSTGGALASEYYSLGKALNGARRRSMLGTAEAWIRVAERAQVVDPNPARHAGVLSIEAHILWRLGRPHDALATMRRSLLLREVAGEVPPETRCDLAMIMAECGELAAAERLLEEGVSRFHAAMTSPAFAVRAKKQCAVVYWRRGRWLDSLRQVREAEALCRRYDIAGQAKDLGWLVRARSQPLVGGLLKRLVPALEVVDTPTGWSFRE